MAPILIDDVQTFQAYVTVAISCPVDLAGYSGTAQIYLAGSVALTDFTNQILVKTWGSSGVEDNDVPYFGNIPLNQWFKVNLAFSSAQVVNRIAIVLAPSSNWTGTMYVDDVVINGP